MQTKPRKGFIYLYNKEDGTVTCNGKPRGTRRKDGYWVLWYAGKQVLRHRLAWFLVTGEWPELQVDHKNGVPGEDYWDNLRLRTNQGNQENRVTPVASSGMIGVYQRKDTGIWTSKIKTGGKSINLGCFTTPDEARAAYLAVKDRVHTGHKAD